MKKYTLLALLIVLFNTVRAGTDLSLPNKNNNLLEGFNGLNYAMPAPSGYRVTFILLDSVTILAGAYVTFNGQVIVSDSDGIAIFTQVPAGSISFLVNTPGYNDYSGYNFVSSNDTVIVHMQKLCSLKFTLTDGIEPINGAIVRVNFDNAAISDSNGIAFFDNIFPLNSSYYYSASDSDYKDSSAIVYINTTDFTVMPIVMVKANSISFTVTDSLNNPIQNARVTIYNNIIFTSGLGTAVINKVINGSFQYHIFKSGYLDFNGNVIISDSSKTINIILASGYDLNLAIINGPNGTMPLAGDTITINGVSKISDENGMISYGLQPGKYSFTVHKTGFQDTSYSVNIADKSIDLIIYLSPVYSVLFNVADAFSYYPIEASTVTFNGMVKLTDKIGNAEFVGISPSDSVLAFQVKANGGYLTDTGFIPLPFKRILAGNMNEMIQTVLLVSPEIGIELVEGFHSYSGPATIRIDSVDYFYNNSQGISFIKIDTGNHAYTMIPADTTRAIISGQFEMDNSDSDFLIIQISEAYSVQIYTIDSINNPIVAATVILSGDTIITDNTGDALFLRKNANSYTYTITKDGFDSIPVTALIIDTSNMVEIVHMNPAAINKNFIINKMKVASGLTNEKVYGELPYPNPTTGMIFLNIPKGLNNGIVNVFNEKGTRLAEARFNFVQANVISVNLQQFPAALYLVELRSTQFIKAWTVEKK